MNPAVKQVIDAAKAMLEEEELLSRNVIEGLKNLIEVLESSEDVSLTKNKCLNQMEILSSNDNLDSYVRTQLWDVTALLERL